MAVRFADGFSVAAGWFTTEAQRKGRRSQRKAGREFIDGSHLIFLCVLRLFLCDLCGFSV